MTTLPARGPRLVPGLVVMAGLWPPVMAGARIRAERHRSVLREAGSAGLAVGGAAFVPAPRTAPADARVGA